MAQIFLFETSDSDAVAFRFTLKRAGMMNPVRHFEAVDGANRYLEACTADYSLLPAVLFIDLRSPDDGLHLLHSVMARPTFSRSLRIVTSTLDDIKSIQKAYKMGAHSFLAKPPKASDLRALALDFPGYFTFA